MQVATGASGTLRAFSALVFPSGFDGSPHGGASSENLRFHPDEDINVLIDDEDLEIVRIKTTEEVGRRTSYSMIGQFLLLYMCKESNDR